MTDFPAWPVVARYAGDRLDRVAMPVGGIGTGCISLGGRGQLVDWEIFNRPSKGFNPQSFFAVRLVSADGSGPVHCRLLEGVLTRAERDGFNGTPVTLSGMPRFAEAAFETAYPLGRVLLSDPALPVTAAVEVFNPLVPGDADASGFPALVYRVRLTNTSASALTAQICGSLQNPIGWHRGPWGAEHFPAANRFDSISGAGFDGLAGLATEVDPSAENAGTVAIALVGGRVSSRRHTWANLSWGDSLLDFWDDFAADGRIDEPSGPGARVPTGSLVTEFDLPAGGTAEATFVIAWHTPNRYGWRHDAGPAPDFSHSSDVVGNYYAGLFADASDVIAQLVPRLADLELATVAYVRAIVDTDLPGPVKDAVLANTAVLKSPTCFRIADGTFLGWEGCNPTSGSCHGSCTHVWNYQYALEQLFPELAWTAREVEFVHSLDQRGRMGFRAGLPLATEGPNWPVAAADGQMGVLLRLHRTWLHTGDTDRLRALWPNARRALEFAWIDKGWDADRDGLMEGCQHNTMDVEYYGPSGVMQSWYLAALVASAELARAVGDDAFAEECASLAARGARATDDLLFDGGYYAQDIRPPGSADNIADGLRIRYTGDNPMVGSDDLVDPDLQIGLGCTADQVVGHTMAALGGLDTGLDAGHVREALASVLVHNHRDGFADVVNHLRTYATADEKGLINCSFPRGDRPRRPFPYCYEVWTGLEYTAAVGLAVEGRLDAAAGVVANVRDRYDGHSRNPFNEVECGNHYVRSMASFGLLHAWPRAVADVASSTLTVSTRAGTWPIVVGPRVGLVTITGGNEPSATYAPVLGDDFAHVEVRADSTNSKETG